MVSQVIDEGSSKTTLVITEEITESISNVILKEFPKKFSKENKFDILS